MLDRGYDHVLRLGSARDVGHLSRKHDTARKLMASLCARAHRERILQRDLRTNAVTVLALLDTTVAVAHAEMRRGEM